MIEIIENNISPAELNSFWDLNASWIFPLIVTVIFSFLGIINTNRQKKITEWQVGISLMEKRMNVYYKERHVLKSILNNKAVDEAALSALSYGKAEARFLFQQDVCSHLDKVIQLAEDRDNYHMAMEDDGYGGYITYPNKAEAEKFISRANFLVQEADYLYSRYIDFSGIGVLKKKQI